MAISRTIGVLTFHRCINYGSYWQARCLVEGLQSRGHKVVLLDHDCGVVNFAEWRCSMQPTLPEPATRSDIAEYKQKVRKFFDAIALLPLSPRFPLHRPEALGGYDIIVIGSDEVWNFRHPWYGGKSIFFGSGLKAGRVISYAASFGNHDAADGIPGHWAEYLRSFTSLSVRDDNSRQLLRGAVGIEAALVLDPCLLFPAPARSKAPLPNKKYALLYGHGFPPWMQQKIHDWSERAALPLVSVGYRNHWAHEQRISAGPCEFTALMAQASAVITNFFHGCIFAALYDKPFVCVPSAYRSNKVRDLVGLFGAVRRMIDAATPDAVVATLLTDPIESTISQRIKALRQYSEAYLDEALQ